ncbi:MAG: 5'/3'-nucleotidase SurE [Alphaproteobacteria bacterium]|nr:5'/3'-nucleotidase SurE [Alphaproteobacteria bacterium]
MTRRRFPIDLGRARILVTNDDGVYAPGIAVLQRVARALTRDVWVVAPEIEQSGASHSLTLRRPLRLRRMSRRRFCVDGTPTDCVLLAVKELLKDKPPDLVLSGVNRGCNLGEDVTYSGTIAAAMEATLLGIPAIALSQNIEANHPCKWSTAEHHALPLIRNLIDAGWPSDVLINVNFPDVEHDRVQGRAVVRQGRRKIGDHLVEGTDPRGRPYYWIGDMRVDERSRRGTDLAAMTQGLISVTPVHMDMTHTQTLGALRQAFP